MNTSLAEDLKRHLDVCETILDLTQRETKSLNQSGGASTQFTACKARKDLLPMLDASLSALRRHREQRQQTGETNRACDPDTAALMRRNQDLIMRILMLDRENEQALLRRGLVPAQYIPASGAQKPHFVADLYRRNGLGSA